jgi:hypothetical protein
MFPKEEPMSLFLIIIIFVVFAILFAGCVAGTIFARGWWKAIPIVLGLLLFAATVYAILHLPNICFGSVEPPAETVVTIDGCPTVDFLGMNPSNTERLINKVNPYPGVLCEYEMYRSDMTVEINMPIGQAALVQDWDATCPTGPECEGTWVATKSFVVPAGWLVHLWVYSDGYSAAARFPSFACEYLAYGNKGHTNANIRTAIWALESGSTLNVPACPGFAGEPGN